ncbi:hypothetical protein BDN70DRAFT_875653 [Pholiota conissans]|uniref:Uncharacterized protein n=1 Tax=Pholiota conissans TaxID=109636 RepID=A0A9P5Z6I8_9AGAR|nr:hypothetical protein BDN70DRAFT_875653 [Pholiota conissans]
MSVVVGDRVVAFAFISAHWDPGNIRSMKERELNRRPDTTPLSKLNAPRKLIFGLLRVTKLKSPP